jgi:hypothetical protein
MIQNFLNHQFIKLTDDTSVSKLQKSSAKLIKNIGKNKSKIASYTLVAFDPQIAANNNIIVEVKQIITDNWPTFLGNTKDTTLTIIRAVILDALASVAKDGSLAAVIWAVGRNIIPKHKLGREESLLIGFLSEIGNENEKQAINLWSFSPDKTFEIPEINPTLIEKSEIEGVLKAAAIPATVGDGGENPNTTITDGLWPKFFATKAAKGLTDIVNKAAKKQIADILEEQVDFLYKTSFFQMRTQLLWWKEAAFSNSTQTTYRNIDNNMLQLAIVVDYSAIIPTLFPISVDYFLKEAYRNFASDADTKLKLSKILESIYSDREKLKPILKNEDILDERISLLAFIIGLVHEKFTSNQFKDLVGISDSTEISKADFLIWLFHDLQAIKLISKK